MQGLLDGYFSLQGAARERFGLAHPEISAYLDEKEQQADLEQELREAFDAADPRHIAALAATRHLVDYALLQQQSIRAYRRTKGADRATVTYRNERSPTERRGRAEGVGRAPAASS